MKNVFIITGILSVTLLFLLSPAIPTEYRNIYSGKTVEIRGLKFYLDCDSIMYVMMADKPQNLFDKNNFVQSRPLYILWASAFGLPYKMFEQFKIFEKWPSRFSRLNEKIFGAYLGNVVKSAPHFPVFVIINYIILGLAVYLFKEFISHDGKWNLLVILLSIILIVNDSVKQFVFTPHAQMFTTFVPIFLIYLTYRILKSRSCSNRQIILLSLLLGFLPLMYGSFILVLPVLLSAYFFNNRLRGRHNYFLTSAKTFLASSFLFFLPAVFWILILIIKNGKYYNYETQVYRQFLWIIDSARLGFNGFVAKFLQFTAIFWKINFNAAIPYLILFFVICLLYVIFAKASFKEIFSEKIKLFSILNAIVFSFIFFWLMGFYVERLSLNFILPLVVLGGLIIQKTNDHISTLKEPTKVRAAMNISLIMVTIAWVAFFVFKTGPFS